MRMQCPKCYRVYDDAEQWTICPHSPLHGPVDDMCPLCDTLESVHGACPHQQMAEAKQLLLSEATRIANQLTTLPKEQWQQLPEMVNIQLPIVHKDFNFTAKDLNMKDDTFVSVPEFPKEHTQAFHDKEELEKLRQFKQYVHNRLDAVGVPADPNPEETAKTGCRIGARLDYLFKLMSLIPSSHPVSLLISPVEVMVRCLIDQKAMHTNKKVRIDEASWEQILKHFLEEYEEGCDALGANVIIRASGEFEECNVTPENREHVKEELADIYGCLVHLVVKAGFNMWDIEERELKKLEERYPQEQSFPEAMSHSSQRDDH